MFKKILRGMVSFSLIFSLLAIYAPEVAKAAQEPTPNITIDYANEKLDGFVAGAKYKINGFQYTPSDSSVQISSYFSFNTDYSIIKLGTDPADDSTAFLLQIPARPATPNIGKTDEQSPGAGGALTGTDATMEYATSASGPWYSPIPASLSPGTYYVRVKATATSFASLTTSATIAAATVSLGNQTISITAPVTGQTAQTTVNGTGYSGSISWYNVTDSAWLNGNFAGSKVYRATVILTSTSGYQWPAAAPAIAVNGSTSVDNLSVSGQGTGNELSFRVTFPATAAAATGSNLGNQTIAITAPTTGATPQTTIASGVGYTGTITWYNNANNTVHTGAFVTSAVYRADVILTSTNGYQWPTTAPTITVYGQTVTGTTVSGAGTGNKLTFSVTFAATVAVTPPTITTNPISDSYIYVDGATVSLNISSIGSGISSYGVVYSKTGTDTALRVSSGYSSQVYGGGSITSVGNTGTITISGLESNTTYYIRGYTHYSGVYTYSTDWQTVKTKDSSLLPMAETESAVRISSSQIDVEIRTSSVVTSSTITGRGVVYSRSNSDPRINGSSVSTKSASISGSGLITVSITGLYSGTYYVRAYATNSYGTAYGSVITVYGDDYGSGYVSTNTPTDITTTSVVLGGYVSSSMNSRVRERGVAYSRSNSYPTITDTHRSSTVTSYGSYSINVSGLENGTRYYARAYVRLDDGYYYYGEVVTFTPGSGITLTILYKTSNGTQIGSQNINVSYGTTVTESSLQVPYGYALSSSYFSQKVTYATTTTVYVTRTSSSTSSTHGVYLEGSSNYRFEPGRNITRIEVAKMVHALRGYSYVGEGKSFSDMPYTSAEVDAVKYVSAMGYMVGDGNFRPYDPITRAEVVTICCQMYGLSPDDSTLPFSDIQNHWARGYIVAGYKNKTILGYPDGTFRPAANMTRAEAVVLFSKSEKLSLTPLGYAQFNDVPSTHWAYRYIMSASVPRP